MNAVVVILLTVSLVLICVGGLGGVFVLADRLDERDAKRRRLAELASTAYQNALRERERRARFQDWEAEWLRLTGEAWPRLPSARTRTFMTDGGAVIEVPDYPESPIMGTSTLRYEHPRLGVTTQEFTDALGAFYTGRFKDVSVYSGLFPPEGEAMSARGEALVEMMSAVASSATLDEGSFLLGMAAALYMTKEHPDFAPDMREALRAKVGAPPAGALDSMAMAADLADSTDIEVVVATIREAGSALVGELFVRRRSDA